VTLTSLCGIIRLAPCREFSAIINIQRWFAKIAAAAALVFIMTAQAHAQSPLAGLSGSWSGSGSIQLANGKRERMRCRAYYTARDGGNNLGMAIRCAAPGYKIELRSRLRYSSGRVSGSWNETTSTHLARLVDVPAPDA